MVAVDDKLVRRRKRMIGRAAARGSGRHEPAGSFCRRCSHSDTTAVVGCNATTQAWAVAQRYVYSPYGSLTVLNADFSATPSGTQPISDYLYQGMTLDAVTGLYYARNRNYSPSLGVWISQDPLQYVNGANTYQMEMGGPVGRVDPIGLAAPASGLVPITTAPLLGIGGPLGRFPRLSFSANNFMPGMGTFDVKIGPETGSPFRSDVEVAFTPSDKVKQRCDKEIKAIQLAKSTCIGSA